MWVFFVVLAAHLRLAVPNGFDVALWVERSQTRLRVSHFMRNEFPLKRVLCCKLAIGKSDSGGYSWVWGLCDEQINRTTRAEC